MAVPPRRVAERFKQRDAWRALRGPAVLLTVLVLVAAAAPLLAPYEWRVQPDIVALSNRAPSWAHPFGTDGASRDILSGVLMGARVSLQVAVGAVFVALLIGVGYGATAAMAGGMIDRLLMRALDVALALPRLLLLLAISAFADTLTVPQLVLLLGATGWYDLARIVRSEIQAQLGREYVLAAEATGVRRVRLLRQHLLPHLIPSLVVYATIAVAQTISLEAGLSFLGLGVQDPNVSWGSIMREGMHAVALHWWLVLFPGLATLFAVTTCNWLGDALRDLFAPAQVPA